MSGDSPDDLRRFAAEVVPAVRELVAAERSTIATADMAAPATTPSAAATVAPPATATDVVRTPFAVIPTPAASSRRSDVRVWDESIRPAGPAPIPDRTYTAHEQASGKHLVDVHDMLRAELAQIQDLIEQVAAGTMDVAAARSDLNMMTMRQNNWVLGSYCESYCRIVATHHTLEDQGLFPSLRRRDDRLGPVLDRLEEEHHVIHDVLDGVDRALVATVSAPDGMVELRAAVDVLSDALLSHLSYEEYELVEPIARLGLG